ncbi:MAG: flagellar basal body L-ring protein FlgH [Proteobacteria bacterium]|nr:flagellar basal body L-ring protein FlgH [Pseudomonadota bacterium]
MLSPAHPFRQGAVGLLGCALLAAPAHADPKPQPGYEAALPQPAAAAHPADGAIFNAAAGYAPLTAGHRARAVGDPVTILLVENTSTAKSAGSKTDRGGSFGVTPPTSGPLSFLNPNALKAGGTSSFKGQGNAAQTSTLAGEVSVTIAEVRANGTALVRGEKRMLLSQGQEWIQFSGIVRLADLDADNRIASGRVADARIEYSGNGSVGRASRQGWLSKFFSAISPF